MNRQNHGNRKENKMPRKGENIYKRKDGRWEGRYMCGRNTVGKAIYRSVYASTYREVRSKLKAQLILTQNEMAEASTKENEMFSDILHNWIVFIKPQLKESSYNRYMNLIENNIIPYLGGKRAKEIDRECIQGFILRLLSGDNMHAALAPRTVRDVLSVVKRGLRYADVAALPTLSELPGKRLLGETPSPDILTKEEYGKLVLYLASSDAPSHVGILLTLFTGLRIGEVCALTWENICLEKKQMQIGFTLQRTQDKSEHAVRKTHIVITKPKSTSSIRCIPLPEFLTTWLKPFQKEGNHYLLTGSDEKIMEPRTLENHFKAVLKKLSIRDIHFHALRHTFATYGIESGFDLKSLSEILGHSDVRITLNRYVHPSEELKREHMEKLSHLFAVR